MSGSYYNEFDPYAAQWLRNLIAAGHIAPGDVDERSIVDVRPDDLAGYDQCHFFAGIGGWSRALRLAGWPDDRPVWTGSCPCQPFSAAGKRKGVEDHRHLWPEFRRLIAECNPPVVFGEQVASADGRDWLSGVRADLEDLGYAVGAADLCAAGVGAPHIRQRLWWVADAGRERCDGVDTLLRGEAGGRIEGALPEAAGGSGACRMGNAHDAGPQERRFGPDEQHASEGREAAERPVGLSGGDGFWSDFDLLPCTDGKARRTQPGLQPLAHGVPARVGKLRAAGNAIVPQVAAEFIAAFREAA